MADVPANVNSSQVAERTIFWVTTVAIAQTAMRPATSQNSSGSTELNVPAVCLGSMLNSSRLRGARAMSTVAGQLRQSPRPGHDRTWRAAGHREQLREKQPDQHDTNGKQQIVKI